MIELDGKFEFGKYKNQYVAYILDTDPDYMIHLHRQTNYKLSDELIKKIEEIEEVTEDM